ncbi:MAG: hypothetical protein V1769_05400 [Thermoplasmatota archaeon]|jgi:hypothetical protein
MSYQIPSDEVLITALKKVLQTHRTVSSQHLLQKLVNEELNKEKKLYAVHVERLRKLVLTNHIATVEIHSRDGDPKKTLVVCPVCGHSLKRVKNLTIWGGIVTIEFECSSCGYWTGKKKQIPTLYVFHYKE